MKIKEGAVIAGLDIKMQPCLVSAAKIWKALGQELVITSGLDGTHSPESLHYYGRALDFRTNYFDETTKANAAMLLENALGGRFDVVTHSTHIHVEYDYGRR